MNEPDGQHKSGYDPSVATELVAEAADLIRALGFTAAHVVLIGGLVPSLLVPVLDPGIEPHVGTADLDLCLSIALVEGQTETYERMEAVLKRRHFEVSDASFRWHRSAGLALTVEFFCPAGEDRPAGHAFRPSAGENPTGKHNFGGRLSALALEAGDLLTRDVEEVTELVDLPQGRGRHEATIRVTGPLAFLVAKIDALRDRDKPKDSYDIIWLIESWPGGPAAAARAFGLRPAYHDPQVSEAMARLRDMFAEPSRVGARSYARFVAADPSEEPQLERRAVGAVAEFLEALPPWEK
ncbi:nucleotidyl transferase AbiEii/AbiGii toxin family protein [Cellulomonas bogoriensis]|uniref:Uncharacterized protein n=1 Tax=Cellulomonas bogoriensis 69B4 = DSM 16987 TaxID=1386082 RepID=A0A0A0BZZ8_9CELL|nr:nucleotidyl transferase AbiEii/AbiGii toxin family protein [Cellulomonas bogoriensis]KGM13993.1 hypothetical protein N869_06870 [Cellulomonas bogoriensis 69B4 = DSM 16987]